MADNKQKQLIGLAKIHSLLNVMGISEEASKEFITVCESWVNTEKERLQVEYETRLEKAKKVCVEETEAHKAALSRGVQLFLEEKGEVIRKAAEKSTAIAESEAIDSLKKINEVLGGISINGAENAQTLQAERKKNANLTAEVANLQERLNTAEAKVTKFSDLCEKSLSRQEGLEKQLNESKNLLTKAKGKLQMIAENKKEESSKTLTEHKQRASKPKTVQSERLIKKNIAKSPKKSDDEFPGDNEIDQIANLMD